MLSEKYNNFLNMIVYQIYPRSFNDTNHDGSGDLNGIIEKLDYLVELGVNAIWISPCYKSPLDDNGYDIADYRDILDEFGTLDDMKRLIHEAHARGIKVLMDYVANHTSDQHKWFQESKKSKDNPYSDYYYWVDKPEVDWGSIWGGSAWEYCPERGQYYLHRYAVSMPDLNWTNPKVRKEMHDVVDFWSNLGIDGFRCDVITEISKDFEKGHMAMGPHIHEYINGIFGRPETEHLFTVGECWVRSAKSFCDLTGAERNELTTMFQFDHMSHGRSKKNEYVEEPQGLTNVRDILIYWQNMSYEHDLLYTLFTDNHDQPSFISRCGDVSKYRYEIATCVATMFYTLRGIPFIYQGQEFGTLAPHYDSIEDFRDISAHRYYKLNREELGEEGVMKRLNFRSRDNARHPVAWDDSEYCGFSDVKPWIPLNSHCKEVNLKTDRESEKSVFEYYKRLLKLRSSSDVILYGDFNVLSKEEDQYFVFERTYGDEKIVVVCNFEDESNIKLPDGDYELVLCNSLERHDNAAKYQPYEAAVYKMK